MNQRIRIKDIALKAGVSTGTVDRVLHNRGNVSKESQEKVLATLKLMDYTPNVLASALAYNKNWKIAVLIPKDNLDPFWSQPKEGILQAYKVVQDYGMTVDFFQFLESDSKDFKENASKILKGGYHAVIITPIFKEESMNFMMSCESQGISFTQINTYLETTLQNHLSYIGQDSYHSGILGAKLLAFGINNGAQVMIIHVEELVYNSQHLIDKEEGFRSYFLDHPSKKIEVITGHFPDPYDREGLSQYLEEVLNAYPEMEGIFVSTSRAYYLVNALRTLQRPDIKLVGFDLTENNLTYLETEEIDFLINQNPFKQGYLSLITIFNYLIRKLKPNQLQHLPLDVVMKENVSYYKNKDLELTQYVL